MPKVWGNIGAWAAEAERAEAEEKEQAATAAAAPPQSYPSLKEAVSTNKGKKKTKMTLQEFTMAGPGGLGGGGGGSSRELAFEYKGLTPEEMMRLPTGPKERSPEEMQYGRLGGGFSSYGGGGGRGGPRMRDNRDGDGDGSWGSNRRSYGGGFGDERRGPPPRVSEYDQPSRADEVDNWAMTKKPISPSYDSANRNNRYGSLGGGGGVVTGGIGGGFSKADEIDNWAASKKPMMPPARSPTYSSGFRDSGGSELDRWQRNVPPRDGDQERPSERRRLVLDPRRSETSPVEPLAKTNKPSPFGAARPREEVLAEKGLDWKKVDSEIESKTSSHTNSRPGSAHSGSSVEGPAAASAALQGLEKTRPKVNPFGDAKPREVLLQEKGIDYRKIDLELEHRRVGRSETEAEKNLKEEIDNLKRDFEKESGSDTNKEESLETDNEKQTSLRDRIVEKERELEQLTLDLDNKVRFSQKPVESPGSGGGRSEKSASQSGSVDDSRSVDFPETPRSRGTKDPWIRTGDEKKGFGGGRDRGFSGNRDLGRTKSRERW